MGFFNRFKKNSEPPKPKVLSNAAVSIGPLEIEEYDGPSEKELNKIIDMQCIKSLYKMLPKDVSYYKLKEVNDSRINGYIREKKIKKNKHKIGNIIYDYYPFLIGDGTAEVDEKRYITFFTSKGTKRKIGRVDYMDFEKFKEDFKNRYFCLYVAGGPAVYDDNPIALGDTYWRVYAVFAGNRDDENE